MDSNFSYPLYHKYLHEILTVMDDISNPDILIIIYNKTIPVLNLLGVAYMSNEYMEKARATGLQVEEFALPPSMELGIANYNCTVEIFPKVSDMVSIRVFAHPFEGRPEWNDEQKELIRDFMTFYFNTIARIRVLRMFESRIFQDPRLPFVGNLSALMRALGRFRETGKLYGFTLYRMNIYKFSRFNRIFGRIAMDKILEQYIRKLRTFSGEFGGVYRLGGDNFFGLIPNEMTPAVQKFFEGYSFKCGDESAEMELQCRVGFYQISSNKESVDTIISRTNATFAKTNPKNKICFFDINEEKEEEERGLIESAFVQAMKDGNVIPYYQPKVDPQTDTIVGVEALCRWIDGDKIIAPYRFIPILEANNRICQLDFYMLRKVCEDLIAWINNGNEAVRASINFSRNNLADKNFVSRIIEILDEYKVPHDLVTVELTETTLETDFEDIKNVVEALRSHNVVVSIDDFGVGYSSLNLIKDINWDVVKIDKEFVPEINTANYDKSMKMLGSFIRMTNELGMTSLVEGVESENQKNLVKDFGCKVIQGYYYDKPMPKQELEAKMLGKFDGECKWHS